MTKPTLAQWLEERASMVRIDFDSIHVDELDGVDLAGRTGPELLRQCCALLEDGRAALSVARKPRPLSYLLAFVPIGSSRELRIWTEGTWSEVSSLTETPRLYLLFSAQIFEELDEEYRRPVAIPSEVWSSSSLIAVYRCWRTKREMENDWEFTRGIYIFTDLRVLNT